MKKKLIFGLVCLVLLSASSVLAIECGTNFDEGCDLSMTTVVYNSSLSPFYQNDTSLDGVIRINSSNVILDFNFTTFVGNASTEDIGVRIDSGLTNVTILNANLTGYTYPVRVNSGTQPNFATVSQGIRNITYNYDSANKRLVLACQGTGSIGLSQLSNIGGSLGYYTVYHEGAYIGSSNSDTYTLGSCSTWVLEDTDKVRQSLTASESYLFFVMTFLIVFGAIYALIQNPTVGLITVILGATFAVYLLRGLL